MASNYTVITTHNIYKANFTFDQPFQLPLADGDIFYADKIIRIIPGRRLVAFGTWQDKKVVAKLFFDVKRAKKHLENEIQGIQILKKNKIPTPELYYQGESVDKRSQILIFERIDSAKNIEELWQENTIQTLLPCLRQVMLELATQHVLGIVQEDLHLKNFLLTEKTVYTLDAAQIKLLPTMLQGKACLNNIALFLSQLSAGTEVHQEALFRYYAKARGWLIKDDDVQELFRLIQKWDSERWSHYKNKIFRESSRFAYHRDFSSFSVHDRAYTAPELLKFLSYPEYVFQQANIEILKAGRSATVVKAILDNRVYVIKRYNIKNILHYLRRCLRSTRAVVSWRLAQKLKLFHVATAAPVAFIETRFFGLRGKSYYVTEYVPGKHIGEFFNAYQSENKPLLEMIKKVTTLLKNVAYLGVTHGDLKKTNILIDENANPLLIDLDGAAEHSSHSRLKRAWQKEKNRFLENFTEPTMQEAFQQELR